MANPDNIVPLHRGIRPIATRDLNNIFRIPSARETVAGPPQPVSVTSYGDETPTAIDWPSFCSGAILGLASGLLAIAVPAIVLARLVFGTWF